MGTTCHGSPVYIPDVQFGKSDKLVSRFIWKATKPRVRFKTLLLFLFLVGLALMNFKEYLYAAQLRYIVYWCSPDYTSKWKHIEINYCSSCQPQARLGEETIQSTHANPIIEFTFKLWWIIATKYRIIEDCKLLIRPVYSQKRVLLLQSAADLWSWRRSGCGALKLVSLLFING